MSISIAEVTNVDWTKLKWIDHLSENSSVVIISDIR